jgi:hypothetical protein
MQFAVLLQRTLLNSFRDIGVFWLRLGMYVGLCLCLGTIYFNLGKSWNDAASRGGLIFFTVSFLTFMSISGFPSFVDEMRVRSPPPRRCDRSPGTTAHAFSFLNA